MSCLVAPVKDALTADAVKCWRRLKTIKRDVRAKYEMHRQLLHHCCWCCCILLHPAALMLLQHPSASLYATDGFQRWIQSVLRGGDLHRLEEATAIVAKLV